MDISQLLWRRCEPERNYFLCLSISDKMAVNLNVFGPLMEYMILSNVDNKLIITMHRHWSRLSKIKLHQ